VASGNFRDRDVTVYVPPLGPEVMDKSYFLGTVPTFRLSSDLDPLPVRPAVSEQGCARSSRRRRPS
jgi:hypothetical protein